MPLEFRVAARGSRHAGVRLPPTLQPDPLLVERLRRPRARRRAEVAAPPSPPLRIRPVLVLAGIGLALALFVPRALAYARLHEAANGLANYALCMAGPTGPVTLLERPDEFWRLVRRRLVGGGADSRPFEACASLLDDFGEGAKRGPHLTRAADFREYAPNAARAGAPSLANIQVTPERIWELSRAAWPFGPSDPTGLVKPSRTARAAAHPVPVPLPASGRGLPDMDVAHGTVQKFGEGYVLVAGREANQVAFVTRDAGQSWAPLAASALGATSSSGQCGVGQAAATFQIASDGDQLRIESWHAGELQTSFPLASSEARRISMSCDAGAALALVSGEMAEPARLLLCPHAARCRDLAMPAEIMRLAAARGELSIARVNGASVLSVSAGGIVRVVSSRDDGETWTPAVVAYDAGDSARPLSEAGQGAGSDASRRVPSRLLALEHRVLLYAGADSASQTYPVLASDDLGASWRGLGGGP